MPNATASVIRVRDVVRNATHEASPDEPILRVPYDLFRPAGAVHRHGELVDWHQGENLRSGRVAAGVLRTAEVGERVLIQIDPGDTEDEWWLCEVEAVDGVAGNVTTRSAQ
jgi:hypothetical protein